MSVRLVDRVAEPVAQLILEVYTPRFDQLAGQFPSDARWRQLAALGTALWLDSGDIGRIGRRWTREFSAVTTNNSLLNAEVQKGQYDPLIRRAAAITRERAGRRVSPQELLLQVGFILNARHGLRLVEAFDAFVSVEVHTDLAHDVGAALDYARRIHELCPERFIVKMPFTPAGLIAARRAHGLGIPVNLTLTFSARQSYLVTRFARPAYTSVFVGRLNAFVADNSLGDGRLVGEKAALASQRAVREVVGPDQPGATRLVGASIRSAEQVVDLAGVDVLTIPQSACDEFLARPPARLANRTGEDYSPRLPDGARAGLETLWEIPDGLRTACDELDRGNFETLTPGDLIDVLEAHGVHDLLIDWSEAQSAASRAEGKIPRLANWQGALADGDVGLDALMSLAGLNAFAADQAAMDRRILESVSA